MTTATAAPPAPIARPATHVIEDRQCQIDAVHESLEIVQADGHPLIRAATGFGKTEAGFIFTKELGAKRVLWLVPGEVLLKQTSERAEGVGFGSVWKWPPRSPWPFGVEIMVVTPITAYNRWEAGAMRGDDAPDLVVVDEAHHCYTSLDQRHKTPLVTKLVREMQAMGVPVLGLTATPWRLSDYQGFHELFTTLVETPSIRELVGLGYLSPLRLVVPGAEKNRVRGGSKQGGEYTSRGIVKVNREEIYTRRAIQMLMDEQDEAPPTEWKQTILYAVSLGHAVKLANILAEKGVPTGFISSRQINEDEDALDPTVEGDREKAVDRFKAGELRAVVNHAIVTEGFDLASAEIVVITRPTLSLALYRQMCGRATRVMPGKTEGIVIDCTDNWERLGGPMSRDVFSLMPRELEHEEGEQTIIITCNRPAERGDHGNQTQCSAIIPNARVRYCPACDFPQGRVCEQCGTFRRSNWFNHTDVPGSNLVNVCDKCIADEKERIKAARNASELGVADRLYDMMKVTHKARDGVDGPGSRFFPVPRTDDGDDIGFGVREDKQGVWRPWVRKNESWLGGRAKFDDRDKAMLALTETLKKNGLMPPMPEPEPVQEPEPEPVEEPVQRVEQAEQPQMRGSQRRLQQRRERLGRPIDLIKARMRRKKKVVW